MTLHWMHSFNNWDLKTYNRNFGINLSTSWNMASIDGRLGDANGAITYSWFNTGYYVPLPKMTENTIIFGGGEPLMQKEALIELVSYAHEKGFRTSLATSGYEMDEETVKRLCNVGLDYVAFTLYSLHSKTQDFLRGVKGSVRNVKSAIRFFATHKPEVEIAIDTVLMEPNRKDIIKLTKWVKRHSHISLWY